MVRKGWEKCMLGGAWDEAEQELAVKAMCDVCSEFYPLFPKNDPSAVPADVEAGIMEPDQEPLYVGTAAEIRMDSTEEAYIAIVVDEARSAPSVVDNGQADQLLGPQAAPDAAETHKRRATFMAAFRQAPQTAGKKARTK